MLKKEKKAFTLIELLIVVGIAGLLAAIAMPKFGEAIEKANLGATLGNLAALRSSINIYNASFNKFPSSIDPSICSDFREFLGDHIPFVKNRYPYTSPPYGNNITIGTSLPATAGNGWYYNYYNGYVYINSIANDILGYCYTIY